MKIGLFFGSFNPVHIGHMIIADYLAEFSPLDEVWLVVSPHNPLKDKKSLAPDYDRLHLVHLAIDDNPRIKACDIEFSMPQPSYTVDTLAYLKDKHPEKDFRLIMGGDNLATLPKWKNYKFILDHYKIYLYKRPGHAPGELLNHPAVEVVEAPLLKLSASFIRDCLKTGRSVRYMLPEAVYEYLQKTPIYR